MSTMFDKLKEQYDKNMITDIQLKEAVAEGLITDSEFLEIVSPTYHSNQFEYINGEFVAKDGWLFKNKINGATVTSIPCAYDSYISNHWDIIVDSDYPVEEIDDYVKVKIVE